MLPEGTEFEEMGLSAMQEVGNIITGAYLNSLSSMTLLNPRISKLGDIMLSSTDSLAVRQHNMYQTGANYGRTVIFYPETGAFHIRAVGKPEKII